MSARVAAVLAVLGGAVVGAAVAIVGTAAGSVVPWSVTVPAGVAGGALVAATRWLPSTDPVPTSVPAPAPRALSASFGDLATLRSVVEQCGRDPDRFESRLRPRLSALVVERLWQRHGLDWRTDTGRAAALEVLSPELASLLSAPSRTLQLTPQTLTRWIRELEDL